MQLLCTPQTFTAFSYTPITTMIFRDALMHTLLTSIMTANSFPSASYASSELIKFLLIF